MTQKRQTLSFGRFKCSSPNSLLSTSSGSTLCGLKSCSSLLPSHTIEDALCTLTRPPIRRPSGLRNKCSKPFRSIKHLGICCAAFLL
jgi:hypothetical protein